MSHILCVDDIKKHCDALAEALRARGHSVTTAFTPEEALQLFDAAPFLFDVVLTDLIFDNSPFDGEYLMNEVLNRRDERGYGITPEVICVTSEKLDAHTVNRVELRGGHYVVKHFQQAWILAVEAALLRIQKFKENGPTLLFVHEAATDSDWKEPSKKYCCQVGESVTSVSFLRAGQQLDEESTRKQQIRMSPVHMRLLDFFARRAVGRHIRLQDVANAYSLDHFYSYWLGTKHDKTIESATVKKYVFKIREALDNVGLKGNQVLVTENLGLHEEEEGGADAYRLRAWPIIKHQP